MLLLIKIIMEGNVLRKINKKSNSGFTMTDLIIALAIFTIFTGMIASLMYQSFKINVQTRMSGTAVNYAIQILEDIDKAEYDNVKNDMEDVYREKFSIPSDFTILVEVSNYSEGNNKQDLVKVAKVTITYEILNKNEDIDIEKLKVKEI